MNLFEKSIEKTVSITDLQEEIKTLKKMKFKLLKSEMMR